MRTATIRPVVKTAAYPYPGTAAAAAARASAESGAKVDKPLRLLYRTLIGLVILLTFEGMLRKLAPNKVGVAIFLFKDVVILFMGLQLILKHKLPAALNFLTGAYVCVILLFIPNIFVTASHDPILAVFGAKQYLLYPIVALAVFVIFQNKTIGEVISFARFVAFLMIPTGLVACLQTQISPNSWINQSVSGDSLENFSSAGHLRVSSTFSFVSQFCSYLNMQMFMIFLSLHGSQKVNGLKKLLLLAPVPFLVVSCFLTGSRGAVIGDGSILIIAMVLGCLRFEFGKVFRFAWIGGAIALVAVIFQYLYPSLMATYAVREKGHVFGVSQEIQERVYEAFFSWMENLWNVPFFGNGIGIMSNGADSLSAYASNFRMQEWMETDFATTLFEGGPWLILVWYGFRYYIIWQTTSRFLFQTSKELFLPAAFAQAFVILMGLVATLGMQPPEAIWWWLSVGLATILWWRSIHPIAEPAVATDDPSGPETKKAARPFQPAASSSRPLRPSVNAGKRAESKPAPIAPVPVVAPAKPVKGRSSYADRLHGEHKP